MVYFLNICIYCNYSHVLINVAGGNITLRSITVHAKFNYCLLIHIIIMQNRTGFGSPESHEVKCLFNMHFNG
jgi:hypothetical protein